MIKSTAGLVERFKGPLRTPYYYLLFRAKALKLGFEEWRKRNDGDDPLPIPPPLLRYRVHGALDAQSYLQVGRVCAQDIKDLLGSIGRDIYSFNHVLDFGCGSGRVMRFFHDRPASCRLYGTDIDSQAIAWCRKHLHFAQWDTNDAAPPTSYADATFDFIYSISVFTHLDERMQFDWLNELKRVSKPGAILILSVHGTAAFPDWSEDEKALVAEKGFLFKVVRPELFDPTGLPPFYQATKHTREYVEAQWSRLFKIVGYVEAGIGTYQDAVILQNQY
ncbi:MAG: class I SAM-dependent methyltransferase [Acidobacteriota bacterium]|nr:class I SAM-dependent methyltransferase [Acidobacteriota bacterium]